MRLVAVTVVALTVALAASGSTLAQSEEPPSLPGSDVRTGDQTPDEDRDDNPVTTNENGDVIVTASTPGVTVTNDGGGSDSDEPPCIPRPANATIDDSNPEIPGMQRTNPRTGVIETWYILCGGPPPRYAWVPTDIDESIVIDGAVAQAIARIPAPTPDVNPAADVGSYVNLGLWLAVTPPEPITVTATAVAGSESFSVTATVELDTTTFDPGDGSPLIACNGHGTPIDLDSADYDSFGQGPCGHTYLQSSPNDAPYRLAISSTHLVMWTASDGRSGSTNPVTRTTVMDYDVDELQTVGSS